MVWVGTEPHSSMHIYSRELHAWVLNISDKSFQSFAATTAQSDHVAGNWQAACCFFKMLDICLSLGFMVAQGNSRVFYCTSLVLQSIYLVLKPSKIMQNKSVDHGLTQHAARCNCSVFVQDKPGKTAAIHLVWQLPKFCFYMGIWARPEKAKGADCSLSFFNVSLHVFLNMRNAAGSSSPETYP